MKTVYICSPYCGDTEANVLKAQAWCKRAIDSGCAPIAPHLYIPTILNDNDPSERETAMNICKRLIAACDELWICGDTVTTGMNAEIIFAFQNSDSIPVYQVSAAGIKKKRVPRYV